MKNTKIVKRWRDMSEAEKKRERARIEREIKRQEESFRKSETGQILAAHSDGREAHPDGPEMNAAIWGLTQKSLPSWIASRIEVNKPRFIGMDEYVIRRLMERDSAFFRKLADALEYLARSGVVASETGVQIPLSYTVKSAILDHWKNWEKEGDKVLRRLAMLEESGYKISAQRYHKLVKEIGLK